ncbi:MAG: hypothetical protein R2851_04465 [Caldilineaceae bacterium]
MQILTKKFGEISPSVHEVLATYDVTRLNDALTVALDAPDLEAFMRALPRLKS